MNTPPKGKAPAVIPPPLVEEQGKTTRETNGRARLLAKGKAPAVIPPPLVEEQGKATRETNSRARLLAHGTADKELPSAVLTSLPHEIQQLIYQNLPLSSLAQLLQVSQAVKSVADDPYFWRMILKRYFPEKYTILLQADTDINSPAWKESVKKGVENEPYKNLSIRQKSLYASAVNNRLSEISVSKPCKKEFTRAFVDMLISNIDHQREPDTLNGIFTLSQYMEYSDRKKVFHAIDTKFFLAGSVNINAQGPQKETLLMAAVIKNDSELAKVVLALDNIGTNARTISGDTAISFASYFGNTPIVYMLLKESNINVNIADEKGMRPIHYAAMKSHPEIIDILLATGNCNLMSKHGSALLFAIVGGCLDSVVTLLKEEGIEQNTGNELPALCLAASRDSADLVSALIEIGGADVNAANKFGHTPLCFAAMYGHMNNVTTLLRADGIEVNAANESGNTSLHCAAANGHTDIVTALLQVDGIDVNAADEDGQTPLHLAARGGHTDMVAALLMADGVDVNVTEKNGRTPLHLAAWSDHTDTVIALLNAEGIDDNVADQDGETARDLAVLEEHDEVVTAFRETQEPGCFSRCCFWR